LFTAIFSNGTYRAIIEAFIGILFWLLAFISFLILIGLLIKAKKRTKKMRRLLTKVS
jgi:hypothetical protein